MEDVQEYEDLGTEGTTVPVSGEDGAQDSAVAEAIDSLHADLLGTLGANNAELAQAVGTEVVRALQESGQGTPAENSATIQIDSDQWQYIQDGMRIGNSVTLLSLMLSAALIGVMLATHFLGGLKR